VQYGNDEQPNEVLGREEAVAPEASVRSASARDDRCNHGSSRKRKQQPRPRSQKAQRRESELSTQPQNLLGVGDYQQDAQDFLSRAERVEAALDRNTTVAKRLKYLLAEVTGSACEICAMAVFHFVSPDIEQNTCLVA
jgi:hypothetical protein